LRLEEALSDAQQQAANEWFDHTLYNRQNDKRRGAIVLIVKRQQEDDLGRTRARAGALGGRSVAVPACRLMSRNAC
jgi:hypothetical protein